MIDLRQTTQYADYLSSLGWTVERIDGVNYFIRKLPLIGSILKIQRPEKIDFDTIDKLCRKYRVFQTILEPKLAVADSITFDHNLLLHHGFKLSKSPYLPTKTLQIDLSQSQKNIDKNFKRNIRTGIKRAAFAESYGEPRGERRLLTKEYSTPDEIKEFREWWKNSVKFTRFVPPTIDLINLRKSFPGNYSLILASHNISGRIIGGVIFTRCLHDSVNYMYGFMSKEGRTSLTHAGLLYQGILWGKKMNCKLFDFEGIYDERFPNKSWLGFSRFKKSFGGSEVLYPGCYTKSRIPI
jgi:lipid II:glycine glycyltransferase (peptidoglycan interpeptide bridge formation enzyme)